MTVRRQKFNLALDGVIVEKIERGGEIERKKQVFCSLFFVAIYFGFSAKKKICDVSILRLAQDFNLYCVYVTVPTCHTYYEA